MKAMVLAAGLGTRLRPLTNTRPKALVEIGGRTLLEICLCRLREFGITDVIINVHYFADQLIEYLNSRDFGMRIEVSREDVLLDTGGGLKKAGHFFTGSDAPFILHNVDVISAVDLKRMVEAHAESGALATLAVQNRKSSRYLLFDNDLMLCGRRISESPDQVVRAAENLETRAFAGIHVISPKLLSLMSETGVFSIIDVYLRLAGAGESIRGFSVDGYYWRDVGTPQSLEKAELELESTGRSEVQ